MDEYTSLALTPILFGDGNTGHNPCPEPFWYLGFKLHHMEVVYVFSPIKKSCYFLKLLLGYPRAASSLLCQPPRHVEFLSEAPLAGIFVSSLSLFFFFRLTVVRVLMLPHALAIRIF